MKELLHNLDTNLIKYSFVSKYIRLTYDDIVYGYKEGYIQSQFVLDFLYNQIEIEDHCPEIVYILASMNKYDYFFSEKIRELPIQCIESIALKNRWAYIYIAWIHHNVFDKNRRISLFAMLEEEFGNTFISSELTIESAIIENTWVVRDLIQKGIKLFKIS